MAVKFELDKKKDQLVPYAALDAFANGIRQKLTTPSSFEKLFTKKEKLEEKKQRIEKLAALIEGLPKKEGRYWFVDLFLAANDGKVDDLAKDLFKDLTKGDAFKELEKATSSYNASFKEKTLAVAKASDALTKRVADAMTPVAGAFGKEFKERILTQPAPTPAQPPVAPATAPSPAPTAAPQSAPTAESIDRELYQSKKLLELGFITENEYLAKLVEIKTGLSEAANGNIRAAVDTALKKAQAENVLINNVNDIANYLRTNRSSTTLGRNYTEQDLATAKQTAGYTLTPTAPASANPAAPGTAAPSGAAAPPAPAGAAPVAPAATPPAAPEANPIASAISTLVGQKENDPNGELVKLTQQSGATQQAFTDMEKGVVAESLTHKQQQLVKLQVKKQVLAEYVKTGEMTTKTQLNEFFLTALILAALAGVIAWATSKLWPMLKDAVNGAPASGRSRGGDPVKDTQNLVQSLGGGYNSQGQYVDVNGKAVPDVKTQIGRFKADLQEKGNVIAAAAKTAIDKADNNVKALVSFQPFQQTFTASPQTEINAVIAALDKVATEG